MSRPPPIAAYTQELDSSYNPRHSDYWNFLELRELNAACYRTAVQFPSLLTRFYITEYLNLVVEIPDIRTAPPNVIARLRFRLNRIEFFTRYHANALRRYILLTRVGIIDSAVLAREYQLFLEQDPAPIWPWPRTPRPADPNYLQQPEL